MLVSTARDLAITAGLDLNAVLLDSFHEVEKRDIHILTLATMEKTVKIGLGDDDLLGYPLITGESVAVMIKMGIHEML